MYVSIYIIRRIVLDFLTHTEQEECMERSGIMGRDEHKSGGKNAKSLPQTPKNQKRSASEMNEEIAKEIAELNKEVKKQIINKINK